MPATAPKQARSDIAATRTEVERYKTRLTMHNDLTIDFLSIVDEGPDKGDAEVDITHMVRQRHPQFLSRLKVRVHHLKSTCPSEDERMDAIAYFFRNEMFKLN